MKEKHVTDSVVYIGADDKTLDLFESQYQIPNGISYNSYVILDDKTAVMDTVDLRVSEEWEKNLEEALDGREPDYLVSLHLEPDHSGNILNFARKYPDAKIVMSVKAAMMLPQFFELDSSRIIGVKEGDSLKLGTHVLKFMLAPMVHWPEVMVAYETSEKLLFSADAFGKFGALDTDEEWTDEARRYYINIVGKYGPQVQMLLKKAAGLEIACICPLHGPVLKENLLYCLNKYQQWSSYEAEEDAVLIAYASIHGNTKKAVDKMADILKDRGAKVVLRDLARADMSSVVADAFRYSRLLLAGPTYDLNLFPAVEDFLYHLKIKGWRKRKAGIMENASWAPAAAKLSRAALEEMKEIEIAEPVVSIKTSLKETDIALMEELADELLK